jgi:hypothetical protein
MDTEEVIEVWRVDGVRRYVRGRCGRLELLDRNQWPEGESPVVFPEFERYRGPVERVN